MSGSDARAAPFREPVAALHLDGDIGGVETSVEVQTVRMTEAGLMSGDERPDIFRVGGPDDGAEAGRHGDDGGVDDICGVCPAAENSCCFSGFEVDGHDVASGEKLAEPDLAPGVPTCLADDGRYMDITPVFESRAMACPHAPVIVVDGDQGPGVVQVGNVHAAEFPGLLRYSASASASARSARAAASSSAVNAPCSACHSRTTARPPATAAPARRLRRRAGRGGCLPPQRLRPALRPAIRPGQ